MVKFVIAIVVCSLLVASNAKPQINGDIFPHMIVGGEDAKQGELPYQIQLQLNGGHYCGGSLVIVKGKQVVITAAHCVTRPASSYTVVAGQLVLSKNSGIEQRRQVVRIDSHEEYSAWDSYKNDIAVLHFDKEFELNENVQPIALPSRQQQTNGNILVSGWGNTQGGNDPDTLQKVELPTVSGADCQRAYGSGETILDSMLCAGLLGVGGKDSCQGDSGGPLKAVTGNYLAGVVSWGYGCAEADHPGVNSRVSYFIDWIESKVQ